MVIWLTGVPGVGKRPLAECLKRKLENGRRVQILDAGEVRHWVHPSTCSSIEERTSGVARMAAMIARNDIDVIVCCMSPLRAQRIALRHRFYEDGIIFHEVWVDGAKITEEYERTLHYEHPDPPDSRVITGAGDGIDVLADRIIFELDL